MGSVSSEQGAEVGAGTKKQPLPLEIPVVATGARPGDKAENRELFTEETETVLVFESGGVIRLSAAVAVGQLIFLTNKQTGKEVVAQVLRKRSYRPTACYVELDFTEPAAGFWGVELPTLEEAKSAGSSKSSAAADLAEAELTEEVGDGAAPPPDQAEVARLRNEVEALKQQMKPQGPATETERVEEMPVPPAPHAVIEQLTGMQQPSPSELAMLKTLLESKAPAKESDHVEEEKNAALNDVPAAPELPATNQITEEATAYPIRMQLPKAGDASPRTAEFAADSAAIAAAHADEHLLPKPSLDFEQFPGVKPSKQKLFSGTARRSLSGPIGAMVAIVLLVVAAGVGAYRLGWFGGSDRTNAETETKANLVPSSTSPSVATTNENPAGRGVAPMPERATEPPGTESKSGEAESAQPQPSPSLAATGRHAAAIKESESHRNTLASGGKRGTLTKASPKDTPTTAVSQEGVYVLPKLVKAIRSLSPPEALRAYASGVVTLDTTVDETGRVQSATPVSGPKALYKKAEETVKDYVYQPATRNGKPVPAHVEVKIQFWYEP